MASSRSPLPQSEEEFDHDPRIVYSPTGQRWTLTDQDGSRFEYEKRGRKWIPMLDEAQRDAYNSDGSNDVGTSSNGSRQTQKKRKTDDRRDGGSRKQQKKPDHHPADEHKPKTKQPTAVYASGLPRDATVDEIKSVFGRYGVIAEELESSTPRIKIYTNPDGTQKGEALVVYFRPESVDMAIDMLDDTHLRFSQPPDAEKMRVEVADHSYKKQKDPAADNDQHSKGSENGHAKQHKMPFDKQKALEKAQKMNEKLADWSDDEPQTMTQTSSRWDKVVILKHMFTLEEIKDDPAAIMDIKEDIRDECSKMGMVTNVVLFDQESDGVVSVRFSNAEAAKACIQAMDGRSFGGQAVKAMMYPPGMRFQKSNKGDVPEQEDPDDEEVDGKAGKDDSRLDEFAEWIEDEE